MYELYKSHKKWMIRHMVQKGKYLKVDIIEKTQNTNAISSKINEINGDNEPKNTGYTHRVTSCIRAIKSKGL